MSTHTIPHLPQACALSRARYLDTHLDALRPFITPAVAARIQADAASGGELPPPPPPVTQQPEEILAVSWGLGGWQQWGKTGRGAAHQPSGARCVLPRAVGAALGASDRWDPWL